ncbi:hypothetical protein KJ912_03140 [Patescibacteria group bacterium]|nr:hypothetical protein [Patescibacteria group bacterium]
MRQVFDTRAFLRELVDFLTPFVEGAGFDLDISLRERFSFLGEREEEKIWKVSVHAVLLPGKVICRTMECEGNLSEIINGLTWYIMETRLRLWRKGVSLN